MTALLGPRQSGKTTLARQFHADHYFDLENPQDIAQFQTPQLTLERCRGLIVIDEIQHFPDLFPVLRVLVDRPRSGVRFLVLGSASPRLLRQSSESLAGRIYYYELKNFSLEEVGMDQINRLWIRGGFPNSYLAKTNRTSVEWRRAFIKTFLERDIPQLGINIPALTLHRFWAMLAHYHGQIMNYAELSRSFGISDMTTRKYVEILVGTFMLRTLHPWHVNLGKRLVKKPKIYFRDSGLFHTLMNIDTLEQLMTHPKLGASWEGFALDTLCRSLDKRDDELYFFATHTGSELDLFWQGSGRNWGAEFKYSDAPRLTKSMKTVVEDLDLSHLWVIYPGDRSYRLDENITVIPLTQISETWQYDIDHD